MAETPFAPIIRTQSDLREAWQELMGPWSFGGISVWMMLVLDDRPLSQLTEITETEEPPEEKEVDGLVEVMRMLEEEIAPGASFAFLRSRPGSDLITGTDRAWAASLYAAARRARVPCEVVHLATRGAVCPVPQDEIGAIRHSA